MPITEVIMDTSGSVDDDLLRSFLRQLKRISKESKLKAGCFDTMFYGFTDIRKMSDIDNFRIYGRGGTDLDAALKGFSKDKKVNKIVFTDGYGPQMLKLDMKVIWVVYDNPEFVPLTGKKVIHVSKEMVYDNNSTTHDYDDDYDDEI